MIKFAINHGHVTSTTLENVAVETLAKLVDVITKPTVTSDKLSSGYFIRATGTKRGDKTVDDNASLLILDGDSRYCHDGKEWNGAINPDLIHDLFKSEGINHIIYTSHSNNVELYKYRVVIPVQYTRNQLDALLWHLFALLHENELMLVDVKENHTFAQAWFFHSYPKEREHLAKTFSFIDGDTLDVDAICAEYEKHRAWLISLQPEPVKCAPSRTFEQSTQVARDDGFISPIEAFNQSYSIHEVLIGAGYKQTGRNRYLHQNSVSGIAGVRLLEDGRLYSDSNDPLNDGYSHDAFDCFMLLECGGDKRAALNWNHEITKHNQRIYAETKKPAEAGVLNLTSNESFRPSQFANS
jgi:hypothetical protein